MKTKTWYKVDAPEHIISPALLVYPNMIEENICPMGIKYKNVLTVINGKVIGTWVVSVRSHN
jgi:hypothetical protein